MGQMAQSTVGGPDEEGYKVDTDSRAWETTTQIQIVCGNEQADRKHCIHKTFLMAMTDLAYRTRRQLP